MLRRVIFFRLLLDAGGQNFNIVLSLNFFPFLMTVRVWLEIFFKKIYIQYYAVLVVVCVSIAKQNTPKRSKTLFLREVHWLFYRAVSHSFRLFSGAAFIYALWLSQTWLLLVWQEFFNLNWAMIDTLKRDSTFCKLSAHCRNAISRSCCRTGLGQLQ